jgi:hypothetical protein
MTVLGLSEDMGYEEGDPDIACVFPFTYLGEVYTGCTSIDVDGGYWCATSSNYDEDPRKGWGYCDKDVPGCKLPLSTYNLTLDVRRFGVYICVSISFGCGSSTSAPR